MFFSVVGLRGDGIYGRGRNGIYEAVWVWCSGLRVRIYHRALFLRLDTPLI